jgi:hypothetical protein
LPSGYWSMVIALVVTANRMTRNVRRFLTITDGTNVCN